MTFSLKDNIFTSEYKIPEQVTFIGSGPKGSEIAKSVTSFNITVNASILLPPTPNIWISKDPDMFTKDWWQSAYNKAKKHGTIKLFSDRLAEYEKCDYTFIRTNLGPISNNTTISGVAIHLAILLGARHIKLCGLDFDGVNNFNANNVRGTHNFNSHLLSMQTLIDFLKKTYNVKFETISETKLKV